MSDSKTILVADDDESAIWLFRAAWERERLPGSLQFVKDGDEVLDYLGSDPPYDDRERFPFPKLLILDLKMPRLSGFEVLEWLRSSPAFCQLPIVVMSSSSFPTDKSLARHLGAREYHVKPLNFDDFQKALRGICERWLGTTAELHHQLSEHGKSLTVHHWRQSR